MPGPVALAVPGNPFDMGYSGLGAVELRFQRVRTRGRRRVGAGRPSPGWLCWAWRAGRSG